MIYPLIEALGTEIDQRGFLMPCFAKFLDATVLSITEDLAFMV